MHSDCSAPAQGAGFISIPVGVHIRLMGSKKALRNRRNFRNSKTTNSRSHMEGCLVLGTLHWIPFKWPAKVLCIRAGGLTKGDEG